MELREWWTDTVTRQPLTGVTGSYGDPAYGAQVPVTNCRVEYESKIVIDPNGNEQQSDTVIYSPSQFLLTDRIWTPRDNPAVVRDARRPINVFSVRNKPTDFELFEVRL